MTAPTREGFRDLPADPTEDLMDVVDIVDALLDWRRAKIERPHDETVGRYYLLVLRHAQEAEESGGDESVLEELLGRLE